METKQPLDFTAWWRNATTELGDVVNQDGDGIESNESSVELDLDLPKPIMSDDLYNDLLILWPAMWLFILPPGVLANGLVIRTFLRMGLSDSVTISFFALALSDFAHLLLPLSHLISVPLWYLEAKFSFFFKLQPIVVYFYVSPTAAWFNTLTSLITTFLAVQRCLCIVKPLHFKAMFTKSLTCVIMVIFTAFSAIPTLAYVIGGQGIGPIRDAFNRTQYAFFITPQFTYIQRYLDPVVYVFLAIGCQTTVIVSVAFMGSSLKRSVEFRKETAAAATTMTTTTTTTTIKTTTKSDANRVDGDKSCNPKPNNLNTNSKSKYPNHQSGNDSDDRQKMSKERTAIIQVALLSSIYLVTNIPKFVMALATVSVSSFRVGELYHNFYVVGITLRITFDYINSAVNFIVYYKFNTKFRRLCFSQRGPKETSGRAP